MNKKLTNKERCRRWYRENRERKLAYAREYHRRNREKRLEQMRQWRLANPHYFRDWWRSQPGNFQHGTQPAVLWRWIDEDETIEEDNKF